jgi:hypothetical protein
MPIQPDPRYFDFGGQFQAGVDNAQQNQRRNALIDIERSQEARREGMYQNELQQQASRSQQAQVQRMQYAKLFESVGLDPGLADTEGADELAAEILKQRVAQPKPPELAELMGPDGRPVYGPKVEGARPYVKPESSAGDYKPQLVETTLPDGSIQKQWLYPGQSEGVKVGAPAFSRQTQLSPKDLVTARNKLNTVKLARQQLNDIKAKFAPLKNSYSAGPFGAGKLPTEAGNAFDAAVNRMRSTLTSLTRVPGVGAMSDYETRLDQAKFPDRNQYESVTADSLEQLDAMLNAVETGYSDLISEGPVQAPTAAPAPAGAPKRVKVDAEGNPIG